MPNLNIDELERLAEQATPGPWVIRHGDGWYNKHSYEIEASNESHVAETLYAYNGEADAAYIVAACNSLPALIKRVRELERQRGLLAGCLTEDPPYCKWCGIQETCQHFDTAYPEKCKESIIQWAEQAAKEAGE